MASGDICSADSSKNYTVTYEMDCIQNATDVEYQISNPDDFNINSCNNVIKVRTTEACPDVNYYIISALLNKYKLEAGIAIIIFGVFLLFLGNKFIYITVVLITIMTITTLLFIIYFTFIKHPTITQVYIILAVGVITGSILVYCLRKMTKLFFLLLGAYIGYLVSIFLYNLFLNNIHASPELIYWVTMLTCMIVFAFIALWLAKIAVVIATSIIGGYMVIKGASLYIGGFPSESMIVDLIKNGEWESLKNVNWH
jgi:hypothetical protein